MFGVLLNQAAAPMVLYVDDLKIGLKPSETRVTRRGPDGVLMQWSNATEKPNGEGWTQVSKAQFPRVRNYIWYRPSSAAHVDHTKKVEEINDTSGVTAMSRLSHAIFHPFETMKSHWDNLTRKKLELKPGSRRVLFDGKTYYAGEVDDLKNTVKIKDPITGSTTEVNTGEVTGVEKAPVQYANGDIVKLAAGLVDKNEYEAMVLRYNPSSGKYMVTLSIKTPDIRSQSFEVYPEGINAFVSNRTENVGKVKEILLSDNKVLTSPSEQKVLECLQRASKSGRSTVTIQEIVNDAKAHGEYIGDHEVVLAGDSLSKVDSNIQYNPQNSSIYIGSSRRSLAAMASARHIEPVDMPWGAKNLIQDNDKETYAHTGQSVRSKTGDLLSGIIDSIVGDIATIITPEHKYVQKKLEELSDETNRALLTDPAVPKYVGTVRNKDVFWILRDREHVNTYKVGDRATLMPGVSNLGRNKDESLTGDIKAVNDDGTVDMEVDLGGRKTTVRAFGRQLMRMPQFHTAPELMDHVVFNRDVYNKSYKVGDTTVSFGAETRDNKAQKHIELKFANGDDYAKNEHLWVSPISSQFGQSGMESIIQSLGDLWGRQNDFSTTMAPSKYAMRLLSEVFPGASSVVLTRDTTAADIHGVTTPVKLKISIDDDSVRGKHYSMDRLFEYYGKQSDATPRAASGLTDTNHTKMWTDGEQMFIRLGTTQRDYRTNTLAKLEMPDTEPELQKKQLKAGGVQDPSFGEIVAAPDYIKRLRWSNHDDADDLIRNSGVFTWDEKHNAFAVSLSNYNKAHSFLKRFYGPLYDSHMFETKDRGWYGPANTKLLAEQAVKYQNVDKLIRAAKENTDPLGAEIDGFHQGTFNMPLRPYQNAAVHFMLQTPASLLAMDQGTGKTVSSIAAAVGRLNEMNGRDKTKKHKVLVVAPASVAQTSWMNDLKKSLYSSDSKGNLSKPKYNFGLLMGPQRSETYKRLLNPKDNTAFGVTSYQTFAMQDWQEIKDLGFDMVLIDEAQVINGDENAGIITNRIGNLLADARFKIAMTGTPIENSADDLRAILAWLNPGVFGDRTKFQRDFVDMDYVTTLNTSGKSVKRLAGIRIKNWAALKTKLDQYMFRLDKNDMLEHPKFGGATSQSVQGTFSTGAKRLPEWIRRYDDPQTTQADKMRIGEISVIPNKSIFPQYSFVRSADKKIRMPHISSGEPLDRTITMDDYPEYKDMIARGKTAMREDYLKHIANGERQGLTKYLGEMQQALNDPSLLDKKYPNMGFNIEVRNPKVERMNEIIQNQWPSGSFKRGENGKIIIFADHVQTINFLEKQLTRRYPNLKGRIIKFIGQGNVSMRTGNLKTRSDIQTAFNNDPDFQYPIMLANKAAQTGINLPAANTVINYDMGWNPADVEQRIDRAHRVRALKDVAYNKSAPARDVRAYNLAVVASDGDINATVESRKIFNHWTKRGIFDMIVRGKAGEYENQKQIDDYVFPYNEQDQAVEELLDVKSDAKSVVGRVDPERSKRYEDRKTLRTRQRELLKRYGGDARYLRAYSDITYPVN